MKLTDGQIEESNKRGVAVVHVSNVEELQTREVEPEFFVTQTFALPALTVTPIMGLDLLRKETILTILGTGNAYICHSLTAANDAARGGTTSGALVAAPFSNKLAGIGALWIVAASGATGMTASIWTSRRER